MARTTRGDGDTTSRKVPRVRLDDRPDFWTTWRIWHSATAKHPDGLAHLALRTKSPLVLDALALAATEGRSDAAALSLLAELDPDLPAPAICARRRNFRAAAGLALAWSGLGRDEADLRAAATLYHRMWEHDRFRQLPAPHHQAAAQVFFLTGRHEELRSLLPALRKLPPTIRRFLETDLAHPYLTGGHPSDEAHTAWEQRLSAPFTKAGLAPLRVGTPSWAREAGTEPEHLFDRLCTDPVPAAPEASDGPLVTVIMPCYQPDEGLLGSIASISAQTWDNLEILVVDDASGPEYADLFAKAVASDDRAALVSVDRNGGSYLARNAALGVAKGELITFQDADDWSHPQRIEQQAQLLLTDPSAPASISHAVRAMDDLTHQWFGYRAVRSNASSLMVRREVFDRIGPFAPIRKGADSEYAERIATLAGPVRSTKSPLAVTRLRTGTLSRGDFTYQWTTPDRLVFRGSYRAWHAALADQEAATPGAGTTQGTAEPPFPVPRAWLRGLDNAPTWDRVDLAYLDDFSAAPADRPVPDPAQDEPDGRTGLWHLEVPHPEDPERPEMHPEWFARMVADQQLVPLSRVEQVTVGHLVVLDPRVLLLSTAQPCRLAVESVEVRVTPDMVIPDDTGLPLDLLAVSDACARWWGVRPTWAPAAHLDEGGREELAQAAPGLVRPVSGGRPPGPR
ncbi:glycosyltransferase family A protein [Ornithinicoccus hortensis]|uniref:Glycosyl transferase family 2 n=1 Tax=Ornithinicoccus hortensis TaxID=82346 RepID=A0A542YMU1_9MICO|nr:glycosyltransferase family A protein [Ornithinicoccus hortensis]TQL49405.1 glycosyl transferase family 2 [Ornithinicoccus hortensis]